MNAKRRVVPPLPLCGMNGAGDRTWLPCRQQSELVGRNIVMLDHLRQHITETVGSTRAATLATSGPADVQADLLPCEIMDLQLYLLVPRISDHLYNLEKGAEVVVSSQCWQVRGMARIVPREACPSGLGLLRHDSALWCEVVWVQPRRVQLNRSSGWGYRETIDVEG